jgi:hypothetical protein
LPLAAGAYSAVLAATGALDKASFIATQHPRWRRPAPAC